MPLKTIPFFMIFTKQVLKRLIPKAKKSLLSLSVLSFLIPLVFFTSTTIAATPPSLPIFLDQVKMDHKRNKQLCYAFEDETPGLPCNPAYLGLSRDPQLWISAFGNNNLEYFQNVSDIIKGPIDTDMLLSMINHNSNEHFAASLSAGYMSETWGFNVIPSKLILFTKIRNPSLPRITLLAAKESEFQFQVGSFFNSEWSWGLQARAVQRSFVYNDTYFGDHFVDGSKDIYNVHQQQSYFLEPSLLFAPEGMTWNPTFSMMIDNLGSENEKMEPYDTDPNLRLGTSISSQLDPGLLQFGITAHWLNEPDNSKIYSSVGANYSVSAFQLFANLGEIEQQLGLALNFKYLSTAISYSRQDWANNQLADTYYTLWRWELSLKF